ncbi:hypothetical protein ACVILH_004501 [Bradyrhizobium sp. USDA 4353]
MELSCGTNCRCMTRWVRRYGDPRGKLLFASRTRRLVRLPLASVANDGCGRDCFIHVEERIIRILPKIFMATGLFLAMSAVGAQATCLSIDYSGPFWVNHCSTSA